MDFHAYRQALADTLEGSELPFPADELSLRLARTRALMTEAGRDALLLTDPADIFYLTGYHTFEVSVHTALLVTAERVVLQVPSIETGPAVVTARVDEIIGYRWEDVSEVIEPLLALLSPCQYIGLDANSAGLRYAIIQPLLNRLGKARFHHDGGALLDSQRLVKSEAELNCLRESARITAIGLRAAEAIIEPGITDNEVAAEGARALLAAGSEFMSLQPIVTCGQRSSVIHVNHKRTVIEAGDPVFLEFGSAYQRYTAPMMRTAVAGRATTQMHQIAEARAHHAQQQLAPDAVQHQHRQGKQRGQRDPPVRRREEEQDDDDHPHCQKARNFAHRMQQANIGAVKLCHLDDKIVEQRKPGVERNRHADRHHK